MQIKFSKLDIGSYIKRQPIAKIRHVVKRQVREREFIFANRVKELPVEAKPFSQPKPDQPVFTFQNFWSVGSFAVAGIALVLVLQGLSYLSSARSAGQQILGTATSAYSELNGASRGLKDQNFNLAKGLFASAQNNIRLAQDKLNNFQALKFLTPQAASADHLLTGASDLAQAGDKLTQALALFDELKITSQGITTDGFNDKILANRDLLSDAKNLVDQAGVEFNQIASIPADYSQTLDQGKQQVAQLSSLLGKLIGLEDLYLGFFTQQPKTYLLVFENYDEARATGGFIGTYGVLQTNNGQIKSLKIESIYNLDGQIFTQIAAPGPFQPTIKKWGIRDANWFADFPTSAQKLLRFFEAGSQTADGVVSVTPQLFENLLKLTGPIVMPQYGVTLTPENFQEVTQFQTSVNYDKTLNQPKKFLADFAPILLNRLTAISHAQWLDLFQVLEDNFNQKQIMLYSQDQAVQSQIEGLGFSGKILATGGDYLDIINSNLGGTKSDLSVKQNVSLTSKILSDGSVLNTLIINRDNLASQNNKNFIRILVPLGSQLVSATGFGQYDWKPSESSGMQTDPDLAAWDQGQMISDVFVRAESGKTEFSGWMNVLAGRSNKLVLTYTLPFRVGRNQAYSLLLQKQDGSKPYEFSGSLNLGSFGSNWLGDGIIQSGSNLSFSSNSASDDFWGLVISQ